MVNPTGFIGNGTIADIYTLAVTNITGTEFLALLGLILVFMMFGLAAKLDFSVIAITIYPILLVFLAYNGEFQLLTTIIAISLGVLGAKYWFSA